jgi:hypothetical protein
LIYVPNITALAVLDRSGVATRNAETRRRTTDFLTLSVVSVT